MKPPIVMSVSPTCNASGEVGVGSGVFVTIWGVGAGAAGVALGVAGSVAGVADGVVGFCAGVVDVGDAGDAGDAWVAGVVPDVPDEASCAQATVANDAVRSSESRSGEPIRLKVKPPLLGGPIPRVCATPP